jgi:sporulation protein YlmC with PRC-barrel domain
MEGKMLKMRLSVGLAAAALLSGSALAQTPPAPTQPAGPGQVITQMTPELMRGSKLVGGNIYGPDNQRIGDVSEVLVDREGKIQAVVVGVGGFLGIGQKDVAIPYGQVQWMTTQQVQAATGQTVPATSTTGGVTTPAGPMAGPAATGDELMTTGTTAPAGTAIQAYDDGAPARGGVQMTKADLQNAPAFRYSVNDPNRVGAAGNTNPPPQTVNPPGNTPPNTPQQ